MTASKNASVPCFQMNSKLLLCDEVRLYNLLQKPRSLVLVDTRDKKSYDVSHIRDSIHIAPRMSQSQNLLDIIESEINAQTPQSLTSHNFHLKSKHTMIFITNYNFSNNKQLKLSNLHTTMQNIDKLKPKIPKLIDHITNIVDHINSHKNDKFSSITSFFVSMMTFEQFYHKYKFLCTRNTSNINSTDNTVSNTSDDTSNHDHDEKKDSCSNDNININIKINRMTKHIIYPNAIIKDGLFLGNMSQAQNCIIINKLQITHILNCTPAPNYFEINKNKCQIDKNINIKYCQIKLHDSVDCDIIKYFDSAIEFIESALCNYKKQINKNSVHMSKFDNRNINYGYRNRYSTKNDNNINIVKKNDTNSNDNNNNSNNNNNNKVLVHCQAGVSRSATIVIAYLMKTCNMNFEQSLSFVKLQRSVIDPNNGFRRQLMQFEKRLRKSRKSHMS